MANPYAGEVALVIDGQERVLKLTLGALAELEGGLDCPLVTLIERIEEGAFSARDVRDLLVAGLRGGGWPVRAEVLVAARIEGGPMGAATAVGQALARAFVVPEGAA